MMGHQQGGLVGFGGRQRRIKPALWSATDKHSGVTVSNGQRTAATNNASFGLIRSDVGVKNGRFFFEATLDSGATAVLIGLARAAASQSNFPGSDANGWGIYGNNGTKYNNNSALTFIGTALANADVIGIGLDCFAGNIVAYRNGTYFGVMYSGLSMTDEIFIAMGDGTSGAGSQVTLNTGQAPFTYAPPQGYEQGFGLFI